ncbi:MAG: hypothetical protein ACXVRZ_06265 [Gaiellaceae bacterium]
MTIRRLLVWLAAAAAGSLFLLLGPAAGATASPACPASAYAMSLRSLLGAGGAELTVHITSNAPGCVAPETVDELQVSLFRRDDRQLILDLPGVSTPGGTGTVPLGPAHRGQIVAVRALVAGGAVLDGQTPRCCAPTSRSRRCRLRPRPLPGERSPSARRSPSCTATPVRVRR